MSKIPEGLELVTDPNVTCLFPSIYRPIVPPTEESLKAYEEYGRKRMAECEERERLYDLEYPPQERCSWGSSRISRFITRYVSWYYKRQSADRTYFLEQLESIARENHIVLPKLSDVKERIPKKRLVCEAVDVNRYDDIYKLKVYYDGENIVGYKPCENKPKERELHVRTKWDDLFDQIYPMIKGLPDNDEKHKTSEEKNRIRNSIECELVRQFYEIYEYDDQIEDEPCPLFISRKLWNMTSAYNERIKRFRRKKDQVKWTAWWTITYSDDKFTTEHEFRRKLLTYFRNKSYRDGWRVMGVFEHGGENNRLHFHGFFYIPKGYEVGELVQQKHYSVKDKCWHEYVENTEFKELFGVNEYEDISEATHSDINAMSNYTSKMLKYMEKGEKVFYSRHIPSEFPVDVKGSEVLCFFSITCKRKIKRYVLSDNPFFRSDMSIVRKVPLPDKYDPYEIGLL